MLPNLALKLTLYSISFAMFKPHTWRTLFLVEGICWTNQPNNWFWMSWNPNFTKIIAGRCFKRHQFLKLSFEQKKKRKIGSFWPSLAFSSFYFFRWKSKRNKSRTKLRLLVNKLCFALCHSQVLNWWKLFHILWTFLGMVYQYLQRQILFFQHQ